MARYFSGLISGKVGDKVYRVRNGKNYISELPKRSQKAPSEAQLNQQAKMRLACRLVSELTTFFPSLTCYYRNMTPRKFCVRHILRDVITGRHPDLELDYDLLSFTWGPLIPPLYARFKYIRPALVGITWENWRVRQGSDDDRLIIIAVNSEEQIARLVDIGEVRRADGLVVFDYTAPEQSVTHFLLAFKSRDGKVFSRCSYAGSLFNSNEKV